MLIITERFSLDLQEVEFSAIRAQGAGGQHVNKTASAVQLRFDINASSLPDDWKQRLLARRDQRLTSEGVLVIKSQEFRSQEQNREAALERLRLWLAKSAEAPKLRRATKPSATARRKRVDDKTHAGRVKALRGKPTD